MNIGLQIPSFKYPGGTAAIRPKLKEIVTVAEELGFCSLWVIVLPLNICLERANHWAR
jgi:hypothetical protein